MIPSHSTMPNSPILSRRKKSSRPFSKKSRVAVGAVMPSQNTNVKSLFHSVEEPVEEKNLVQRSSEKTVAEQEVSVCYAHWLGISEDGMGATKSMIDLGLIWVVAKTHVEVKEFPKWPCVIEIDSWIARAGKMGMRRDSIVRRCETKEVLVRATSIYCMMDSTARRLSKIPDAAYAELSPFFWDDRFDFEQTERDGFPSNRIMKLDHQSAQFVSPPFQSCSADLDVNQHVSNVKYINWTLQSVSEEHLESHNLTSITLEYIRECQIDTVLESLSSSKTMPAMQEDDQNAPAEDGWTSSNCCQFIHLLQTQGSAKQQEILRARTTWRPKSRS